MVEFTPIHQTVPTETSLDVQRLEKKSKEKLEENNVFDEKAFNLHYDELESTTPKERQEQCARLASTNHCKNYR